MNNTTSTTTGPPSITFEYPSFDQYFWLAILLSVLVVILAVDIILVIRLIYIRTTRRVGVEQNACTSGRLSSILTLEINNLPEVPPNNATPEPVVPFNANQNAHFLSFI